MLVLAILVIAGAIAAPVVMGPLEGQRLRKAADQVRASFNRARVAAMRTGQVHFFRFQPNTGSYAIEALNDGEGFLEASAETAMALNMNANASVGGMQGGLVSSNTEVGGPSVDRNTGLAKPQELPENMMFIRGANLGDLKSARLLEQMQSTGDTTLSQPILFYPDGASSTSQLIIANQQEQFVVIRLRGLTGLATVSELLTPEELPE